MLFNIMNLDTAAFNALSDRGTGVPTPLVVPEV
jgi:hypothetical protein